MGVQLRVEGRTIEGKAASGAGVVAVNRNAWKPEFSKWVATLGADGKHVWDNLDKGSLGDLYDFSCEFVDADGILWEGAVTERISRSRSISIPLRPAYRGKLEIPENCERTLERIEGGPLLLTAIFELRKAVSGGLIQATLSLSTTVLEGLVKLRLRVIGKWKAEWDSLTFGGLITQKEISGILPPQLSDRILGLAKWRNAAAHFKGARPAPEEAQLATGLVKDMVVAWFSAPMPSLP